MSKHRLIGLHNHQIQFELDNEVYLIKREEIENRYKLYWFMADLYKAILRKAVLDKDWLKKFKI